jgi:hypothetical protein
MLDIFISKAMAQSMNSGLSTADSLTPYMKYLPVLLIGFIIYIVYHQKKG